MSEKKRTIHFAIFDYLPLSFLSRSHARAFSSLRVLAFTFCCVLFVPVVHALTVTVSPADFPAVARAAADLRADLARAVPSATNDSREILVGTLGRSPAVDALVAAGRLDVSAIKGQWESSVRAFVDGRWVVAGSDRRGTVYGVYQISSELGVSPFYWWDDIPVSPRPSFDLSTNTLVIAAPAVKYRGIFVNDEDWGLRRWAEKNFESPEAHIGARTYAKIFELMLRCRLNTIWPAMHEGGYEFSSRPENLALAEQFGVVVGTSHCEPMLRNNVYWTGGEWNYRKNKAAIDDYWRWTATTYASNEVIWTIGMRGKHDGAIVGAKTVPDKIRLVEDCIATQTNLLETYVRPAHGGVAPAMNFVPYKEVLGLYNAGLKIPDASTVMWVNDNFGYVRRLGGPAEHHKGGIYWHVSYCGRPISYLQTCTTPPGFMWYELGAKCAANDATEIWIINVGDVKQADILIHAFGQIAWSPSSFGPDAQSHLLLSYADSFLGLPSVAEKGRASGPSRAALSGQGRASGSSQVALSGQCEGPYLAPFSPLSPLSSRIAAHLAAYYTLGVVRKPEHMCSQWVDGLDSETRAALAARYAALSAEDEAIEAALPPAYRDPWFEAVGYQVRFLAAAGSFFTAADSRDPVRQQAVRAAVAAFNSRYDSVFGGKWRYFWFDTTGGRDKRWNKTGVNRWSSLMHWPWNDSPKDTRHLTAGSEGIPAAAWRDAADCAATADAAGGGWRSVAGLGTSGRAMALLPIVPGKGVGASLDYTFDRSAAGSATLVLQFLPDYRLYPGLQLRVNVSVNGAAPVTVEIPTSNGRADESSPTRTAAVLDNFVRARLPVTLRAGANTIRILALDPGPALDRLALVESDK